MSKPLLTHTDALDFALIGLSEIFGTEEIGDHVGGHMTCTEADALARVLLGVDPSAAAAFLAGHAAADDSGDDHHWPGEDRPARALAYATAL